MASASVGWRSIHSGLGVFVVADRSAAHVLVGIGILVEIARRLGMGFIAARAEVKAEDDAKAAHRAAD